MTTQTLYLIDEYLMQGGYTPGIDAETLESEAHLIAAAPDLLAALEDASAYIDKCSYVDRAKWLAVRDTIETAIAKAKGE
jgi:hypothetical protein